jgi:GAF domain-containing protein
MLMLRWIGQHQACGNAAAGLAGGSMYDFAADPGRPKPELYREVVAAADAVTAGEPDGVANMANVAALVWQLVPELNWAGF